MMVEDDPCNFEKYKPSCPISAISCAAGIPIQVHKIAPDESWKDDGVTDRYTNQKATNLLIDIYLWGKLSEATPPVWLSRVGSVLVTSHAGDDITPQQIEALCAYGGEHLLRCKAADQAGTQEALWKNTKPENFEAFYEAFEKQKLKEDPGWTKPVESLQMATDRCAWDPMSGYAL